jgi:hypothetical protein
MITDVCQRGTHLVEVALALGFDRDHQRRLREGQGGQHERRLAGSQRVAGGRHGELRDGADLAGLQFPDRLLLLAVEQQ